MDAPLTYRLDRGVATITMDDGKRNALSPRMFAELDAALDRAEKDRAVVVLTGREDVFSAGFDLKVLRSGGLRALGMVRAGFELAGRMLAFPTPIVVACSGHAIAMGTFLLVSADYRIGTRGPFKITANEVAIGLTVPRAAAVLCQQRLSPAHLHRALALAEVYAPEDAVDAGFLDRVVAPTELAATAEHAAHELARLDLTAHARTKLRLREHALASLRAAIRSDLVELGVTGARRYLEGKPQTSHPA
jgi:enoyl-CoA hydratase